MSTRRKKRDYTKEDPDGTVWLAIGEVARRVSRRPSQIRRWCAFWEATSDDVHASVDHPLPECRRDLDGYGTRYFREDDLPALRKFRDQAKAYGFFSKLDKETWQRMRTM